jgi:hypothetical protein
MDNFLLFICGIVITLIGGMGVLVYMVNVGYQQRTAVKLPELAVETPAAQSI